MIDGRTLPEGEPIYTWIADDGTNIHIHAERLRQFCLRDPRRVKATMFPIFPELAHEMLRDNVASQTRVIELLAKDHLDPILIGHRGTWTNGAPDVMIIDGHHRYVLAWQCRLPEIPGFFIRRSIWQKFQVINVPNITQETLRDIPIKPRHY